MKVMVGDKYLPFASLCIIHSLAKLKAICRDICEDGEESECDNDVEKQETVDNEEEEKEEEEEKPGEEEEEKTEST